MKRSTFLRLLLLAPLGGRRLGATECRIDRTLDWLLARQSSDGAWRSTAYGAFRDGRALTPVVLRALSRVPDRSLDRCRERAARWLIDRREDLFETFPVHASGAVLEAAVRVESLTSLRRQAADRLEELRGPDAGWSYSPVPPKVDGELAPMQQSNLSATALALDGLHAAGARRAELGASLEFIRSCQNFARNDPDFDDGGFFQITGDPTRNKAGTAGIDRSGRPRFRSYAAATADGLRALLLAGENEDAPSVNAARSWLDVFSWSPDAAPPDLAYYGARSIALTQAGREDNPDTTLHEALTAARRADGSWHNPAGEMRENCPLVATALAFEAMMLSTN